MVEAEQSERFAREVSSGDVEIIEGRGHMLPHIIPDVVLAALARVEAASATSPPSMNKMPEAIGAI